MNNSNLIKGGVTLSVVATVVLFLMAQSKQEGVQDTLIEINGDRNTVMEARMEKRETKFDKFLTQQNTRNTVDSMNTITLMKFLEIQLEFNGEVKEHIIKSGNE